MDSKKMFKCRDFYKILIKQKTATVIPTCIDKWAAVFPELTQTDLSDIFINLNIIKNPELKDVHFETLHRYTPTKLRLYRMNIKDDYACNWCGDPEDLVHFYVNCAFVQKFWNSFVDWLTYIYPHYQLIPLTGKDILLGRQDATEFCEIINYLLVLAKFMIRRMHFTDAKPNIFEYIKLLKMYLITEEQVAILNNKHDKFNYNWAFLIEQI